MFKCEGSSTPGESLSEQETKHEDIGRGKKQKGGVEAATSDRTEKELGEASAEL